MIPVRPKHSGDIPKALDLNYIAKKDLAQLQLTLSFNDLPTGSSTRYLADGSTITVKFNYGIPTIEIVTKEGNKTSITTRKCLCLPHFTMGVIVKTNPENVDAEFLVSGRLRYDVLVCAKTQYLYYKDAYDANFGYYKPGNIVLVSMANEMSEWENPLDCDRPCLAFTPRFKYLSITPISIKHQMQQWEVYYNGVRQ